MLKPQAMRILLLLFIAAAGLQGCGNKGPLYLPDKDTAQQQEKN
jgi:predicted small lipoprotein YifL